MSTVKAQERQTKNVLKVLLTRFGAITRSTLASIIAHTLTNFMEGQRHWSQQKKELIFSMINFIEYETCTILKHLIIIALIIDIMKHTFVGIVIFDQNTILDRTAAIDKQNKLNCRL